MAKDGTRPTAYRGFQRVWEIIGVYKGVTSSSSWWVDWKYSTGKYSWKLKGIKDFNLFSKIPTLPPENVEDGGDGGVTAVFAHRGNARAPRAARSEKQLAAFISNIFIGFSAEILILQIIGARWTRAGWIQIIECLELRRRKYIWIQGKN